MSNGAYHQNLAGGSTGDPYLDLLAQMLANAFSEAAQGDYEARRFIIQTISPGRLEALRKRGLIIWRPDQVHTQLEIF